MAKIVRKLPINVILARQRDYKINKEYQERAKQLYPKCPSYDCVGKKEKGLINRDCFFICPNFSKENWLNIVKDFDVNDYINKLSKDVSFNEDDIKKIELELSKMTKKKTKENATKKTDKQKVNREERIKVLLNKPSDVLKPSEKAWLTIWKSRGIIQSELEHN